MTATRNRQVEAEPAWEVAQLFPHQGHWSEEEYVSLTTNHLVEFSHGRIEVLPMPSEEHQDVVFRLAELLAAYVRRQGLGKVAIAPLPVQLWPGKFREPDVQFMLSQHAPRRHKNYWDGADLVVEVVSPDDPLRDTETKRREYANAGIPEYWIVEPVPRRITVLVLEDERYSEAGIYTAGEQARSLLLPGFAVDVEALFAEQ